ncbi:hypothetical protein SAMN05421542_3011 [Chryseobacterium jejuense]|uniref:Uncharacterized protein n=1 Tax=Chryseobacterium jejuense TaxID=445960 RepID=A0A2X2XRQ3_CHRJE|nr:hypothetical protein SAMN05421542_3011 [Chryseobacterium jejuense]SQB28499.1 Uncharacterised protein [Chryseobacterium jejuense]
MYFIMNILFFLKIIKYLTRELIIDLVFIDKIIIINTIFFINNYNDFCECIYMINSSL